MSQQLTLPLPVMGGESKGQAGAGKATASSAEQAFTQVLAGEMSQQGVATPQSPATSGQAIDNVAMPAEMRQALASVNPNMPLAIEPEQAVEEIADATAGLAFFAGEAVMEPQPGMGSVLSSARGDELPGLTAGEEALLAVNGADHSPTHASTQPTTAGDAQQVLATAASDEPGVGANHRPTLIGEHLRAVLRESNTAHNRQGVLPMTSPAGQADLDAGPQQLESLLLGQPLKEGGLPSKGVEYQQLMAALLAGRQLSGDQKSVELTAVQAHAADGRDSAGLVALGGTVQAAPPSVLGIQPPTTVPSQSLNLPLQHPKWADSMAERVVWMANQRTQSAEIRLNPANLGQLEIKLSLNDEQASVAINVQNAQVREAVETALPRLREILAESGIQLQDASVSDQREQSQQPQEQDIHTAGDDDAGQLEQEMGFPSHVSLIERAGGVDFYA